MGEAEVGYIKNVVVFNRRLGCTDESATDEEQSEKILYYYPEETSLYMQLSKMTMIESLIEFSAKFSNEPIDVVLMEGALWGFYQGEPDVWIVVALDTQVSAIEQGGSTYYYKHSPNGEGLVQAIEKMYMMYKSFFGSVGVMLRHAHQFASSAAEHCIGDEQSEGWRRIRRVAALRKVSRKLRQKCRQIEQDIEVTKYHDEMLQKKVSGESCEEEDDKNKVIDCEPEGEEYGEQLGIRSGTTSLTDLNASRDAILAEIAAKADELEVAIGPVPGVTESAGIPVRTCTYSPALVSHVVSVFMRWYLTSGELVSPSGLNGMWGMHFSALGNPSYYAVERLRSAVARTMTSIAPSPKPPLSAGCREGSGASSVSPAAKCLILFEGQVIWNDFFDHDVMHLYEFLRLQHNNSLREAAQFIKNVSSVSPSVVPSQTEDVPASTAEVNIDASGDVIASGDPSTSGSGTGGTEKANTKKKFQTLSKRFSASRRGNAKSSSLRLQRKNSQDLINSYTAAYRDRQGFMGPGWNSLDFMSPSPPAVINESGQVGAAVMQYYAEGCNGLDITGAATSTCAVRSSSEARDGFGCEVWCPRIFSPVQYALEEGQGLGEEVCYDVDVEDGAARRLQEEPEYDGGLGQEQEQEQLEAPARKESMQALCLGRALVYQQARYTVVVVLPDWSSSEEFHSNLSSHSSSTSDSNDSLAPQQINLFSFCTLLQMNLTAAITANLEEYINARYLPAPTSGPSVKPPEGVSFVCCNNLNVAFKAVNVYRGAVSPQLAWPAPMSSGCEDVLALLQHGPQCFPLSSGQLIGSFQPGVVAAINHVGVSFNQRHSTAQCDLQESCIRVTSAFRGGVWVLGRCLGERNVVFVVEGCSTVNDVHDSVNRVLASFLGNVLL